MDEQDPLTGKVIAGRYRIVRRLGVGAMGTVYLAEHVIMGRHDAIKVLRGDVARDAEAVARFMRGARIVSGIRHPNVCTVYDCGHTEDGSPFLAMEFVEGETLKDLLEREVTLSVGRAVKIASDIADALEAAHDAGVIHRDLKPGNVMITPSRRGSDGVKVVDFDIAKETATIDGAELTRVGFVVGTPEYMSPEQLTHDVLDARSDIYSLAIVLFRMLTGRLPFRGSGYQDIAVDRLVNLPLRLDEASTGLTVPPGLQEALDRALQRVAGDRYQSAADFRRAIVSAVADHPPLEVVPARKTPELAPSTQLAATRVVEVGARDMPARHVSPWRAALSLASRPLVLAATATAALVLVLSVSALVRNREAPSDQSVVRNTDETVRPAPPEEPAQFAAGPSEPARAATHPSTQSSRATPQTDAEDAAIAAVNHDLLGTDSAAIDAGLVRQLVVVNTGALSDGAANAIGDTARSVWHRSSNSNYLRAFAAYVLANVAHELRNRAECVSWLRRALELSPGNESYTILLPRCGDPGS
jgi:serine/threonine protein kinase